MNSIEPPQMIKDVYRDLRDRHLLLPAVALIVGLIAVPLLLKSSEAREAPTPAPVVTETKSAVAPAVLAEDSVTVRNYRKRLAALQSKNPFRPQPNATGGGGQGTGEAGAAADSTSTTSSTGGGSSSTGAYPTETGTVDDPANNDPVVEEDVTVDETTVDEDGGHGHGNDNGNGNGNGNGGNGHGNGGNEPSGNDVEVVGALTTRRVDVMVGLAGAPKLRENVKPMTILPDPATPVVAFLGTDEKGKRAAFVVARDATLSGGTAACVPAPENCLYITLEKGETATLDFGPDGQKYELRLLAIRDVELKAE